MSKSEPNTEFLAVLPAFISEADEQTEAMESLLLEIEENPNDSDLLNSLFRCAHTVKGSAGMFGLNRVVAFTHHVETLLDQMREGKVHFSQAIGTLLLQCNDQMRYLVKLGFDDDADTAQQQEFRAELVQRLQELTQAPAAVPVQRDVATLDVQPNRVWRVSANFGLETFRSGMDPLGIANFLASMGSVVSMQTDVSQVPALEEAVYDSCYLSFVMDLQTLAPRTEIEGAFSFVEDDCTFSVVEIETQDQHMQRMLEDLPATPRIGEMLLAVGAVTKGQLDTVLHAQKNSEAAGDQSKVRLGTLLVEKAGVAPELVNAALGKQQKIREKQADESRFIRVQADRLDTVINLLGELVIAGAGTGASLQAFENRDAEAVEMLIETLTESNHNMNRLIEEIRSSTLGLRMVPVGETFTRFKRMVRDTANALGKEVQFEIVGGDAELDKSMVEKIADPLMHLVRNSLDHGLELPAEREAAGKPAAGRLTLSAHHEAGAILIRIQDDGRGIHRERVLGKAWERGLVERGVVPDDEVIDMLIFRPGFSTAEQITDLSGRGVGMDVVRTNIEALRGTIKLRNTPGQGLTVDIRLPLTLAIIDGFLVGVGDSRFVLPLESVMEVIESDAQNTSIDDVGRHFVELREAVLPVVRLRMLYDIESSLPQRVSVVVVNSSQGQYGIEVEVLMGQHQTVIKPLGQLFKTLQGIAGSAILGSGDVALIIDVDGLRTLVVDDPRNAKTIPKLGHAELQST